MNVDQTYSFCTSTARGPLSESSFSNSTLSPSLRKTPMGRADWWTKTSFSSSPWINPYPFLALNHCTVPFKLLNSSD